MNYTITAETAAALDCIKKYNDFLKEIRAIICVSDEKETASTEIEEFNNILIASEPFAKELRRFAMERIESNLQYEDGKL